MRMMRSRLSALVILNEPGSYSSKVDPVEKNRLAALRVRHSQLPSSARREQEWLTSSVLLVIYRVATTDSPSETQKLSSDGSLAPTALVYALICSTVASIALRRSACGIVGCFGSVSLAS